MRLLLLFLAACGVESPEEASAWDDSLAARVPPAIRGCGDATIAASNLSDTRALFLNLPGIVGAAHSAGGPITLTRQLPDPAVSLTLQAGQRLTSATCVGAFPFPGPTVYGEASVASGQIVVTATPTGGPLGQTATLDVQLTGLTFVTPAGVALRPGDVELMNVDVGLYPP
jgi:hypothetical protein